MNLIDAIIKLEKVGVIGKEQCPEPAFWRWPLNPDNAQPLPPWAREMVLSYGEIRWYGHRQEICDSGYLKPCRCHHWSPEDKYPATPCPLHPDRMWEWDGYCYICIGCVVDHIPDGGEGQR